MKLIAKMFNFWFSLREPIRFILVGGYNTALGYLLFAVLNYYLENYLSYLVILLFSYIVGILNNFIVFKIFVFRTKGNWIKECLKIYVSYAFLYPFNAIMLYCLVEIVKLNTYVSQGVCVIVISVFTYFVLKYFSFKPKINS